MSGELETAALASGGGWLRWKRQHADIPPGTPCANCATPLQGTYCHVCGQLAEDFHRSSWHLLVEAVESLLHLDGRLFNTLPNLIRRPGQLTRDYLNGKRAWQVQPFRMFLVILLIVLFVSHLVSKATADHEAQPGAEHAAPAAHGAASGSEAQPRALVPLPNTAESRLELDRARAEIEADPEMTPEQKAAATAAISGDWATFGKSMAAQHGDGKTGPAIDIGENDSARMKAFKGWADARIQAIRDDPERFALIMEIWLHRVAILALPVSALMLSVLFVFNRRFFVFDHLVFSMHSLSFQMLLVTTILLLSLAVGGWAWWLLVAMPIHLFLHMKGTYERSTLGTLARMAVLFVMTTITFSLLALLWFYLGFNEMAGH
jgi:hypothetical protein